MAGSRTPWWQTGIIYQIYPRSFADGNGDGIGDLPGITSRLDYCRWLGVDALWLSPIFPSPMADFGYDVSDYIDIEPIFGTLADFDEMLAAAHRLDLRIILDFVPNHTSDQHPWFLESRSARDARRRDWYIWLDPAPGGGPPNNWVSVFGGSAWTWDESTGQYYFHSYLSQQPDLNWRNPEVREAMWDVLRFWLDRGVDGFRIDAISRLIKDAEFRDNPLNPDYRPGLRDYYRLLHKHSLDQPEVHEVVRQMRGVLDEYGDRVMIGEAYLPLERVITYYEAGVHFPFNFQLIKQPWDASAICRLVERYEEMLPRDHWPNWVLGNHDNHRVASRIGRYQTRVAAMLLLTLRGTPTLYYGDEIGMVDVPVPPDQIHDPWEKNVPGMGVGRDPERTPMQWNSESNAGFTTGTPWLPVAEDFEQANVAVQRDDAQSLLALHRRLIQLRAAEPALQTGNYQSLPVEDNTVAYLREQDGRRFLVALNLGSEPLQAANASGPGQVRLSTLLDREGESVGEQFMLRGDEGIIAELL